MFGLNGCWAGSWNDWLRENGKTIIANHESRLPCFKQRRISNAESPLLSIHRNQRARERPLSLAPDESQRFVSPSFIVWYHHETITIFCREDSIFFQLIDYHHYYSTTTTYTSSEM